MPVSAARALKRALIPERLRGAEAPLFHGHAWFRDFFRSLLRPCRCFSALHLGLASEVGSWNSPFRSTPTFPAAKAGTLPSLAARLQAVPFKNRKGIMNNSLRPKRLILLACSIAGPSRPKEAARLFG